jgi:hypothetical protein
VAVRPREIEEGGWIEMFGKEGAVQWLSGREVAALNRGERLFRESGDYTVRLSR